MLLADFADPTETARWRSVGDIVMGGQSASTMLAGDRIGVFAGTVSLASGGGFASVRRRDHRVDLSAYDHIALWLRGDGHRYKLNLRDASAFDGVVYQAPFETQPGICQVVRMELATFAPRYRGRPASGTLDPTRVCSLGLLIADRQAGPFRLELSTIEARRALERSQSE